MNRKPNKGLLVALILGATLSIVLSLVVQLALGVGGIVFGVIVAPFTEEPFKALSVVIVALFVWKTIPNRRYGAALGTAAGLGFGIAESLLYIIGFLASNATADQIALQVIARIIVTPLMHPVWSAIVGVGIFVLLAKKPADKGTPLGLALLVLVLGTIGHMMWNGVASGLLAYEILPVVLNIIIIFPIFAIILRDFLGGHFNFQNFFQPLPEPPSSQPPILLPPPPPPP
jgi:RsiW-degrading membrane proteinase PrsW (M82 family)